MKPQLNKKAYQSGILEYKALGDSNTYELSVCSDQPYMRPFGMEILSCAPGAVDMTRFTAGAVPLLFGHDSDKPAIGIVESFRLENGQGIATVRFDTNNPLAQMLQGQVNDGIQKNVSVGYQVSEWFELPTVDAPAYVATKYEIFEVSLVPVPADATVGFRSADPTVLAAYRDFQAAENAHTDLTPIVITERDNSDDPNEDDPEADDAEDSDPLDDPNDPNEDDEDESMDEQTNAKSLVVEQLPMPLKADLEKRDMSDEIKPTVNHESLTEWAVKAGQTANLVRWMKEGFTLDRAKAEAFDTMSNEKIVNIPVDIRAEQKISKADVRELSIVTAIRSLEHGGESAMKAEGDKWARENNLPTNDRTLYIKGDMPMMKRTMVAGLSGVPQNLVGFEYLTAEAALREGTVCGKAGVEIMYGVNSLLSLPIVTTGSAFAWMGSETSSMSNTDLTTRVQTWSPKVATVNIPWSMTLDTLNQPYNIEDIARTDVMNALLEAFEGGILAGAGTGGAPTGLYNDVLIPSYSGSAGAFNLTRATALWKTQRQNKGSQNNLTYLVTPASYVSAQTTAAFSGAVVPSMVTLGVNAGVINTYPAYASNFMNVAGVNSTAVLFGDFSKVLATVSFIKIVRDDWNGLANGIVNLRGFLGTDVHCRQPFGLVRDLTCNG